MQTLLSFILVFGIIVIVHEFGHFYFAKKAGILVREFSIGMGPKLFQTHKNETSYTIRVLPLGGYVLMAGYEDEEDIRLGMSALLTLDEQNRVTEINLSDDNIQVDGVPVDVLDYDFEHELYLKGSIAGNMEDVMTYDVNEDAVITQEDGTIHQIAPAHRQIQNASLLNRVLTNFGGPLNNFLLAIVAFIIFAFLQGGVPSAEPILGEIQEESPAAVAGLEKGDQILTIEDDVVKTWNEMMLTVQEHPEEPLTFEVKKTDGQVVEQEITPALHQTEDGIEYGLIGVEVLMNDSFKDIIVFGFTETWAYMKAIVISISMLVTGRLSLDNLGGPIAIFSMTSEVTRMAGILGIINFIGFLSVNLGLMNLLPIPGLDGGKLLLNIVEGIRGKPISEEKQTIITLVGVVLLILLMLFVTWNDIQRYFFN